MKANATREGNYMKDNTKPLADMADTAMKNYEQAVRTSLKFQEEAGKWWSSMLNQATFAQDMQKRFNNVTGMANTLMPLAQRRMEEVMSLVEKNGRTSAELMKKAVDAAQTPVIAESQAKWTEFWTSSMGAARSNAEALAQISTRTFDSWIDFIQKNTEVTEIRVPKTA
ncbi:MAG TPA: hypothetical protein VN578_10255 [Candidatus Binatia bacterium]|jgi:hypothetical protein|nr:hypothetical protein [Candidatus Binatia bacterium]